MARQAVARSRTPLIGLRRELAAAGIRLRIKRAIDVVLAGAGLLISVPLFAVIALAIVIESRGPVFFRQKRVGLNGRTFGLYKLRTMIDGADELKDDLRHLNESNGSLFKIRDDPRLTRVGRVLRRLSLDELPQLLNVLRGDMSLVGPRPLPLGDYDFDHDGMRDRLVVRPGLTGLWQVSGRSEIDDEEMVLLDKSYISDWSLTYDVALILRTIPAVISGRGAH